MIGIDPLYAIHNHIPEIQFLTGFMDDLPVSSAVTRKQGV